MKSKKVFLATPKPQLLNHLSSLGYEQASEIMDQGLVIMTESLDFDTEIDGWGPEIKRVAKREYIKSLVYDTSYFSNEEEMYEILGHESSTVELFDNWFDIELIEYIEIPTCWKS